MYQFSVFLHVLAVVVWLGGLLFIALVAVPVARHLPPADRSRLVSQLGLRFRTIAWTCFAIIVVTGTIASAYRGVTIEAIASGELFATPFGRWWAVKVVLALGVMGLSALHDFVLGPRSTRAFEQRGLPPDQLVAMRRRAGILGRATGILGMLVVLAAILMTRGAPW